MAESYDDGFLSCPDGLLSVTNSEFGYRVYTIDNTSVTSVTLRCDAILDQVLAVGGGGAGGTTMGGGGGGGGVVHQTNLAMKVASGTEFVLSIGKGGAKGTAAQGRGQNGGDTTFSAGALSVTAKGGGGGGGWGEPEGSSGGCGGGGSDKGAGGAGTEGQGCAGARCLAANSSSGGGGGATEKGFEAANSRAGHGGKGYYFALLDKTYGGGGGGGGSNSQFDLYNFGEGGEGGGGNGGKGSAGSKGTDGLGGGGGGGGWTGGNQAGGVGGSGAIVLVFDTCRFDVEEFLYPEVFTGSPVCPSLFVTAEVNGETVSLEKGRDYTVTYFDNVLPGKAKARVTGINDYDGSETAVLFEIKYFEDARMTLAGDFDPREIAEGTISKVRGLAVLDANGDVVDPSFYEVCYTNNDRVGTATVWAKMTKGELSEMVAMKTFEITDVLPRGYTFCDWIESTGTQYIKTGVKGASYGLEMRFGHISSANDTTYFGTGSWGNNAYLFIHQSDVFRWYGGGGSFGFGYIPDEDYVVTVERNGNVTVANENGSQAKTLTGQNIGGSGEITFFSCGNSRFGKFRLYSARLWDASKTIHDYVPAVDANGKPGLYDRVNGGFLKNAASGADFVVGPLQLRLVVNPIADQRSVGGAACRPDVGVVTDRYSYDALELGKDYEIEYVDADKLGTATAVVKGLGVYAGVTNRVQYTIVDGGPATPYPNLSRSYVPNGLVGFWDAIDNAGTGAHDATARTWKDLSRFGNDGTLAASAGWADGNAFTNNADGNPCVVPVDFGKGIGWANVTWETAFRPTELDVTRTVFSTYHASTYGTIFSHNNGTTYKDGSMRYYARSTANSNVGDAQIKSVVKGGQLAYFTLLSEARYLTAYRDNDFASSAYASNPYGNQSTAGELVIGGRDDVPAQGWRGDIRFLRVYNRVLTPVERKFNRALDRIRHENRSLRYELPEELPDGYRYDKATDTLSVRVSVNALSSSGLVSLDGGEPTKQASAYFPVGTEVSLAYTGKNFERWDNLGADVPAAGQTAATVTFVAGAPVTARAISTRPAMAANAAITAHSYVQKGLVRQFDGIDNTGAGRHNSTVTRWTDLCGSGADWVIRSTSYGGFEALGLTLKGTQEAAYMTTPVPTYATAEFTAKANSGYYLFSNADDYHRIFILRPDQGVFGAQRYNGERGCQYGDGGTQLVFGVANTFAAVYRDATKSIVDIDYYLNGAAAPYGREPASNWGFNSYAALGSQYAKDDNHVKGTIYSIRLYDRPLTDVELAFNAALDQVRYFGADAAATLGNLAMPDGYRWNAADGVLEVRVDVTATGGTANFASGTWVAAGTPVEIAFAPAKDLPARWFGLPRGTTLSADGRTIAFTAYAPAAVRVRAEQKLSAFAYVADGLIGLWDAEENVAPGTHDGLSWKWHDLTGCQQEPWSLARGRADFRDDALCLGGCVNNYQPLYQESLLPDWNTAEAYYESARTNGAVQLISNRFASRLFYIDARPGQNCFGGRQSTTASVGTDPSVVAGVKNTYSIVYDADGALPQDFFVNGGQVGTKTGSYNYNVDNEYPAIGSRYNNCDGRALGLLHVLRLYSRPLTAAEVAFNAAIDRVRYGGAALKDELPAELPDGWRWNTETELLEVRVTGPGHDGWHPLGETVTLTAAPEAGRAVRAWSGLPAYAALSEDHTAATFAAWAPVAASVETSATAAAYPRSVYLEEGLIASWDGYDAETREPWGVSGDLEMFGNAAAFDGTTYMSNFVSGVKTALMNKTFTVQLFLRPKRYIKNGGYIHVGTATAYRDLVLNMSSDKSGPAASRRGAFGALQYAANNAQDVTKTGLKEDTTPYFGADTLVSIVRDDAGARIAFNDADFAFTNSAYSSLPTTDQVNIGTWLGTRNATFDLYAVRIYDRVLTDGECRYNGAIDRARFCGEELSLPEGFTNDLGVIKSEVTFVVPDGTGVISVNGAAGAATQTVHLAVGEAATVLYVLNAGFAFEGWTGLPGTTTYAQGRREATFTVGGPATYQATGLEMTAGDDNFDSSVVLPTPATVGNGFAYAFTNAADGTFAITAKKDMTLEEAIVVGGGGQGGTNNGGGGGGGGVFHFTTPVFVRAGETFTIQVGAGGTGGTTVGRKGESTRLVGAGIDCEAFGGGGGGGRSSTEPSSGGSIASGGGRTAKNTTANQVDWHYDSVQGNPGGLGLSTDWYAGGGGGATEVGLVGLTGQTLNGRGGRGLASAISGELCVYGSGGGAGAGSGTLANVGGPGAGNGGVNNGAAATSGADGLGGGGGGGANAGTTAGGNGGAGGVVLRFADGDTTAARLVAAVEGPVYLTGASVEPAVTVTLDGAAVDANDYEVVYLNNTAPGFGGAVVKGKPGTAVEGLTATVAFEIRKPIFAKFAACGAADGTTWADAMEPQAALTAAQNEYIRGGFADVLLQAGSYPIAAALTLNQPCAVRGGYAGEEGVSLALAGEDAETTFDGQGLAAKPSAVAQAITVSSGVVGQTNVFERCGFGRFVNHGFVKSGASHIRLVKCRIFNNTWGKAQNLTGRGFNMAGSAASTVAAMEDCEVFGNGENGAIVLDAGSGFGGYFGNFKRVYIDNCHFVTNGWGGDYRSAAGAAFYVDNAPVTIRRTEFIGNQLSHPGSGGTIYLNGNCGGSALTNCLFLANAGKHYGAFGTGNNSGAVHCHFSSVDQTIDLDHCTFAYNLQGCDYTGMSTFNDYGAAAGLDIYQATARVRNCIFWGNSISSGDPAGADINVYRGSADVDWTLFGGLTADYIRANAGAAINLGEHVVVGDPQFVSRPEQAVAAFSKYASPRSTAAKGEPKFSSRDKTVAFDAHLVSTPAVYSRAIDMADPSEGVRLEPMPNGGIANLGCYGNTPEAATSIVGRATLAAGDVGISFPDGVTSPRVSFALGSADELPYNARVTVYVGDDWSQDFAGVRAGETVTANCPRAFEPGATLPVKVVVSAPGQADVVVETSATVSGETPPWIGHGGDPEKVVHVRAGSTAVNPKGTSWTDAYPTLEQANAALTATRNEIWFAGTLRLETTPADFSAANPATIRGGFTGVEDTLEERTNAVYSTLDGQWKCTPFVAMNSQAIAFERVCFTHGSSRAVNHKSSRGGLSFDNCAFICNGATNATAISGAAVYYTKGDYAATDHVFTNCRFEGNGRTISNNAQLDGACIYVSGAKSLTVSDCTFLTNGAPFSLVVNGTGAVRPVGTCVYASATPCVIERCRFAGNRTCCYKTEQVGGLIYFTGTCDDSVVRNCAFVGNECVTRTNTKADGGSIGGMIVANLGEAIRNIYVENCTFAWDFACGLSVPADICAHKGIVNVKNSIFFGGQVGDNTAEGTGRYLNANANGAVNVAYSMFDVAFTNAAGAAGVSIEATCMTNNPAFVTANLGLPVWRDKASDAFQRYTNGVEQIAVTGDVHLVSAAGHFDNAGVLHDGGTVVSPAIDAGDPEDDFTNEPMPNGGFVNLGAYGNTEEASRTYTVEPEITDDRVDVTFPDNTSFPRVEFDLKAAAVDYTAVVRVYCGTNAEGYSVESPAIPLRGGERFGWLANSEAFAKGTTLHVKVVITSGEHVVEKTLDVTVEGEMPKWFGKGGGEHVIHVWAEAPGAGTGKSWKDAFHSFDEAIDAYDENCDEIWITGDYTLGKTGSFTPSAAFAIRGGFDACENTPAERTGTATSRLNANNSFNPVVLSNGPGTPVVLDRLTLINSYDRAVKKTGGGDLTVISCQILTNGIHGTYNDGAGKGILVTSAAGANIVVTNTLFSGNRLEDASTNQTTGQGSGSGMNVGSAASLTVVDCQFYCNGHPLVAPSTSHSGNPRCGGIAGSAIYSTVPTTITFSRFCGNTCICDGSAGGVVALRGAAKGSRVEHCVFAGNLDMTNGSNGPGGDSVTGGIAISLDDAAGVVDIVNDTFAYNISAGKTAAAGLTVKKGVANVRNCVFWGNRIQASGVTDVARDINVRETGTCNVSFTLLSADDETSYTKTVGGVLNDSDWSGMSFGDPLFISPESCVTNYLKNIATTHIQWDSAKKPDYALWTIDVHELSCGGYFNNAGEELNDVEEGIISMAVDGGDNNDPYDNELPYNGRRINAGAYGNTSEAAKSATGEPEVEGEITIDFPESITRPQISFKVGGTGTFLATADVELSTDGGETWTKVKSYGGINKGQTLTYFVPAIVLPTDILKVRVTIGGGTSGDLREKYSPETSVPEDKRLPHWYGHGGDSNKVIHVRADAFGDGSGRDWENAVNGFQAAMAMLTETRNEIWLAVSNVNDAASKTYAINFPIAIRGGFDGREDRIEDRADGVRSFIDGRGISDNLTLANAAPAYIERIEFLRGAAHAFQKSASAGDLTMVDCAFLRTTATANSNPEGRGGRFEGDSGKTATLALTNCVFGQNSYGGYGCSYIAAFFKNFKDVYLDNCLFATNGMALNVSSGGNSGATCFGASGARIMATSCRFIGNNACSADNGGTIYLNGGCSGTVFRNCQWVGNLTRRVTYTCTTGRGGCVYVAGSFQERMPVLFENCTFAYNVTGSNGHMPGAIRVGKGHVSIRNCIFHGNAITTDNKAPADIYVDRDAEDPEGVHCTVEYTMFDELTTNCFDAVAAGLLDVRPSCCTNDPVFVTSTEDFFALVNMGSKTPSLPRMPFTDMGLNFRTDAASVLAINQMNVHLRSRVGYRDETTGELRRFRGENSPALDAGDPNDPGWRREADTFEGTNGRRINLGCWGGTPHSTLSPLPGNFLRLR